MKRAFLAALVVAGSVAIAGPVAAAAESPTAAAGEGMVATTAASAIAGEVGTLSANGCTGRNGPGHINRNCVLVVGEGTYVERIRGYIDATNYPPTPLTFCGVKMHVWATYANGSRFDKTGTAQCSYVGHPYYDFHPRTDFKDGTSVCGRTYFNNEWSAPACIEIQAD